MKPRSRNSGPSAEGRYLHYEESSDEDDVQMEESSDSDYFGTADERQGFVSMIGDNGGERHLDLSHEQESDFVFSAMEGFVSDSDPEDKIPKGRNVGLKRKKGRKIGTKVLGGKEVQEDLVDGSNQEKLEVPELVIDYQAQVNIRDKRRRRQMKINMPILMWELWEEQDDRWVEANARIITHLDNQTDVMVETAETPSDLILPLLRYQKEWLAWALKQEESVARGGILADEMGMGKTVQAIALVLAKREFNRAVGEHSRVLSSYSSSTGLPEIKATLVICPVVALRQWENEIDRFTSKGSNKVLVYHGAKREKTLHEFSEYDFVITTYSIVEAEYRKNVMPPKVKCECGKSYSERKMISHLRHCRWRWRDIRQSEQSPDKSETSKGKTSDKGKASESEDDKKKEVHMQKRKNYNEKDFGGGSCSENSADVESGLCKRKFSLHSVKWNRIILDEAHYTKDRLSNTTKAVHALESSYKWALSGTPIQNHAGEIYSLIRFLQIIPYSYYFCKDCDCRTLDYSLTNHCPNCLHHSVRHFSWWSKFVAKPIRLQGDSDDGIKAMILLNHKIFKSILLRRTKKGRAADLSLPPRIFKLRRDSLDAKEEDFYTSVYNNCEAEFNTFVKQGVKNNFVHIFDLLMRLRQAVNHFYLVEYSESAMLRSASVGDDNNGEKVTSCAIKGFKPTSILNKIQLDGFQSSTKIDALREEIRFMVERDGSAKGIVFSQFTSFLDLIHYSLWKCGVNCVQLDGSMSTDGKNAAIKRFTEDPDCRIFLVSLKAGGVALNLTVASHVFLMDPWWNPAVEKQAQDRIHRIGQHKPIRIVRFVIENTIEEKLLKLQQKKELVSEGTVDGSLEALGKLTEDDLRFLFL